MFSFWQPANPLSFHPKSELASEPFTLVHLAPLHAPPGTMQNELPPSVWMDSETFEHIALSQFNIAKTILANPDAIVVKEGLCFSWTRLNTPELMIHNQQFAAKDLAKLIKDVFPRGIPEDYAKLSQKQKNWLIWPGATMVLFYLDALEVVYKAESVQILYELNQAEEDSEDYLRLLAKERELCALELARDAVKLSKKKNPVVLLVYGIGHEFAERICIEKNLFPDLAYAGRVNTVPKDYEDIQEGIYDKKIEIGSVVKPLANSISMEKLLDVLDKYKAKPLDSSGSQHGTLISLLMNLATHKLKIKSLVLYYNELLDLLSRIDKGATVFKYGLATDVDSKKCQAVCLMLDLRDAFIFATSELSHSEEDKIDNSLNRLSLTN